MIILSFVLAFIFGLQFKYSIIFSLFLIGAISFIYIKKKRYANLFVSLAIFAIGIGVSFIKIDLTHLTYQGIVTETHENYFIFTSHAEKYYVYEKENTHEIGDILDIKSKKTPINFSTIESSFDFGLYLDKKGVNYELSSYDYDVIFTNPIRIREIQDNFLSHFPKETRSLVSSILFSIKDDSEIIASSKELHLSRFFSSTGLYITFFISCLSYLLSLLVKKKWADLLSLGILSIYFVFTFPRFAVLRVLVVFILRWINNNLIKKKLSYPVILTIAMGIFILLDYHNVYQDSFILGFSIPIFSYLVNNSFIRFEGIKKKAFIFLVVYLFLIPFEVKYYQEISLLSPVISLILSPVFCLFGLCSLLCFFRIPIYFAVNGLGSLINWSMGISKGINFALYMNEFSEVMLIIYYFVLMLFLFTYQIMLVPIYRKLSISLVVMMLIYVAPIKNMISSEVTFINVGQGDCCLIRQNNTSILIDTGGMVNKDVAKDSLIPYFKKKKIYKLDLVMITHEDSDHCGALDSLVENFKVNQVIKERDYFPVTCGNITFTNYNTFDYSSSEDNYNSLVIGFKLNNLNYLVTGDAPKEIENKMMEKYEFIPCDILKVGHHGSNTSTSDKFIKYLSPKEGVISVGKNNKYGHPNSSVLNILKQNNVAIKRTDILGTISYFHYF